MRPLAVFCGFSLCASSLWALGESDAARRAQEAREGFFARTGLSFSYDDNVLRLAPEDMAAWREQAGSNAARQRFDRMESLDDGIFRFQGGVYEQARFFNDEFASRWGVDIDYFKFRQNTIKDYPAVRTYARQYFTADHYVEAWFAGIVNRFERNYFGKNQAARRFPGTFDTRSYGSSLDSFWGALGGLESALSFTYDQDRHQEPELEYRNSEERRYKIELGRRLNGWAHARAGYAFQRLWAARSPRMDASFQAHRWEAQIELTPSVPWKINLGYHGGFLRYASKLGGGVDPFHAGRRDFQDRIKLKTSYRLGGFCELWAAYAREERRTNLSHSSSDEFLRYLDNSYSLGIQAPLIALDFLKSYF